jgi:hypothetical protein
MISADPTVPDPLNAQSWNRYSYVGNDPLAFTDPSGFSWLSSFFHSVSHAVSSVAHFLTSNPIVKAVLQIGITVLLNAVLPGLGFITGSAGLAFAAAAGGAAIVTGLSGGKLSQILQAGLIAGATAFAFYEVGDLTGHTPSFGTPAYAENVVGHALVGCASSAASGGSCGSGALSGAVTAGAGPLINGQSFGVALVENAVLGGAASVAGGGKFANGAITGAFGYMFNNAAGALNGLRIGAAGAGIIFSETGPVDGLFIWAGATVGAVIGDWATGPDVVYSTSSGGSDNTPRSSLPRAPNGDYLPDPDADGPHSTIGTRTGSDGNVYRQGATFNDDGEFLGRTDVTDHGRPDIHTDPHFHPATSPNGVGSARPIN